jgi:hypothetical protein
MTLEFSKNTPANSLDTQPKFQQLIIPGMEEFLEKNNTQVKQKSSPTSLNRQGFKDDTVGEFMGGVTLHAINRL